MYFTVVNQKRIRKSFRAAEGDWRRVDLHLHTPASADWLEPGVTYLEWLQKAESKGLDIVAITDHNTVEGIAKLRAEIERLTWLEANDRLRPQERRDLDEYRRIGDKLLVLPGFEFTAMFGFHILAIFPPETPLRKLELLLLRLNVPDDRLVEGSTEVGASTDVLTAYRLVRDAGGLVIAAHANSTHGVALQGLSFGGQTKIAFTQDINLHALEVTDLESVSRRATARFFDGSKPEYPRRMHCIQGSDAHRLNRDPKDKNRLGVGDRVTEIMLPEVSFESLQRVLEDDDFTLTRPYRLPAETPFDHVEAAREQGNTIIQAFHENLSREGGRLHKVFCDVVAFANTSGGTVYIGVSATRKTVTRGVENADATAVMLRRELERNITPPLDARVDVIQSLGVPIVRIIVPNGSDKPYALGQTRIYVRQEGETNEAVRDELVQLVLADRGAASAVAPAVIPAPVAGPAPVSPAQPAVAASAASAVSARPAQQHPSARQPVAPEPVAAAPAEVPAPVVPAADGVHLPAVGVEIVAMEERKGSRYFIIRDLRNGNVVQNVTMASARKLWSYAISQYLTNQVDADRVTWSGDFGLWQSARRAKKMRYDLALRQADGPVRVFYGVTADGMSGPWAQFLKAEDRGEPGADLYVEEESMAGFELAADWESSLTSAGDAESESEPESAEPVIPQPAAEPRKPARRTSRPRSKGAKAEPVAPVEPEAEAPAPVSVPAAESVAVPAAKSQPARRSRRPRAAAAQPQPEAAAAPQPVAEPEPEPPAKPASKPRTRSRKPKAAAETPAE